MDQFISVPKFNIKNNYNDSSLNKSKWRYLYDGDNNDYATPNDPNFEKQLPWLTLYKTHDDLLQVRLVTTIGYVEKDHGYIEDPPGTGIYKGVQADADKYEATFIKGFPLMLQSSSSQLNDPNYTIPSWAWENNWNFYKSTSNEDFSGNLQAPYSDISNNWLNLMNGDSKVITDMYDKRNLIVIALDDTDFKLKGKSGLRRKFPTGSTGEPVTKEYNGKNRPQYLVIRIDSAVEETAFAFNHANGPKGIVSSNLNTWTHPDPNVGNVQNFVNTLTMNGNYGSNLSQLQAYSVSVSAPRQFKVYNYVYHGYVISPYDFMAAFTTDYIRGFTFNINSGTNAPVYVNDPDDGSTNTIQINSKFFSETANLKDGWSDRKNNYSLIKTPYYHNFFLYPSPLDFKAVKPIDPTSERFDIINNSLVDLYPEPGINNTYYIEKLIWSSLTSPRHTQYTSNTKSNNSGDTDSRFFIGNYLNVNEVEVDYNGSQRVFNNSNADYMPIKNSNGFKACGYIETVRKNDDSEDISGSNIINMPRKTLTPYYSPNYANEDEWSKYAFNWSQPNGWNDYNPGNQGVDGFTGNVDVGNCYVIEYRNLVNFLPNTELNIDISLNNTSDNYKSRNKKNISFVISGNDIYSNSSSAITWKNSVTLGNNSVLSKYSLTADQRSVNRIDEDGFRIKWYDGSQANTKKHAYVIDIAAGSYLVSKDNINIFASKNDENGSSLDAFFPAT